MKIVATMIACSLFAVGTATARPSLEAICSDASFPPAAKACVVKAALLYRIDPLLLRAVLHQEAGPGDRYVHNPNGTYDIGAAQYNSGNLGDLRPYGITNETLLRDECTNVKIGAWFLKREIVRANYNVWLAVGNYHSHTPSERYKYQLSVWQWLQQLRACG